MPSWRACSAALVLGAVSFASHAETITVPLGRSELITFTSDMNEVIVTDPDVADAYVHGKRKVSISGKKLGTTDVRILGKSRVLRDIDVRVSYDLPAIRRALKRFMPNENVGVEMLNWNVALTGSVSSAQAAEKAVRIVEEFLDPVTSEQSGQNKQAYQGNAQIPMQSKVVNMLDVTSGQQVMLRVRIGEIRRSALKNLGVNLQAIKSGGESAFQLATGGGIDAFTPDSDLGFGGFQLGDSRGFASGSFRNSSGNGISAMLEALERDNLFKVLAEPNLVAMSGEEAEFLAGGEFPIPVAQQQGAITIQYQSFGVSVKFTPFVLSPNRIRIAVQPEVSEISDNGALEVDGFFVPALTTRRAKTVVELSPGESFMIAGLIQDELSTRVDNLPGIKEIPILGSLFSSVGFQRDETELVLAVTPHLVDPIVSSDVKLPTDDFRPPSTMDMFFYGAISGLDRKTDRVSQTPTIEGPVGFMVE